MNNAIEQLCPNCGLCCNGVLFADVELPKGDDAKKLVKLGLSLAPKGKTKTAFPQPCACLEGGLCSIYADRPKRCRTFECGLLKRVGRGELKPGAALKSIRSTLLEVEKVHGLLESFEGDDELLPTVKRFSQMMSAPMDLSAGAGGSRRRGKLMVAMDRLMQRLQKDFLND